MTPPTAHRRCTPLILTALAALAVFGVAAAGAQNGEPTSTFEEAIAIEVVNIDVTVVDKKGRPVTGLRAEDFELRVDGQPVTITNFSPAQRPAARREQPPGVVTAAATAAAEEAGPASHLVLFLDNLFLEPGGRQRVMAQLPPFVTQQLATGTRIMTVAQDDGTTVVHPFTSDPAELTAGMARIAEDVPSGLLRRQAWLSFTREAQQLIEYCAIPSVGGRLPLAGDSGLPADTGCSYCEPELMSLARAFAGNAEIERRRSLQGLANVVSALSGIPGRKSLLYVSDGFAEMPGAEAFYYLSEVCPENQIRFQNAIREESGASAMRELTGHANANRVTVYSLEAAGLRAPDAASVDYANVGFRPSTVVERIRVANTQGALFYVANETGGKAVLNANDLGGDLDQIGEELETFYSLGYSPRHAAEGTIHQVGVRLPAKRNLNVRYRRAFLHKPASEEMGERTLAALVFGMEENPLAAACTVETPVADPAGDYRVPITITIPRDRLLTLPEEDFERGRLTVIVAAELDGEVKEVRKQELNVARPKAEAEQLAETYAFGIEINLPAGVHTVGVGLWDRVAQQASFLRLEVAVEPAAERTAPNDAAP